MSSVKKINWNLCCLCQLDKPQDVLQTPKEEGLSSLERDLNDFHAIDAKSLPSGINITINDLNDGSGIAATLKANKARYHKICRSYCSSSRVKRAREKLEKGEHVQNSPKKLRSSGEFHRDSKATRCVICEQKDQTNLHKVETDAVDANMKRWAKTNKNFPLLGRLTTAASDLHAADICYHHQCYVRLRDSANASERQESAGPTHPPFNPIICAQIVASIEHSETTVFKLSELREMYQNLMRDLGHPCQDKKEPHSTRFKDHLLKLLPEWSEFSQGDKGRRDIYLSHKSKVADELAKTYVTQMCQEDALLLMRAAIMMHKFCLESQEPFDGSFPSNSLTAPVNREMRIFFNVVLRGPSALHVPEKRGGDSNLDVREKIACNISQLLIYNACKGTHHDVKSAAVRHNKKRETPFPLYHALKLHGNGRNKQQIDIDHEHGISVSYNRVMEVKQDIARAVCARHTQDGVVVPTNSRFKVFTTHDVDNIDSKAQGNFSMDEFHGYVLSVTNHLSHDNHGVKRTPIKLDPLDTSSPKLPDSYVIQTPVELPGTDVFAPKIENCQLRPSFNVDEAKVKDEAWISHVTGLVKQGNIAHGNIITWSGYNSTLMTDESIKPPAEIGVYPLFPDKAATASSMKHAMELAMQGTQFLNPGQTSILGADQPLYALIKQIQWQYPDAFGEDKLVAMMGALHIEDKMHQMIGKLLRDSGWTFVLTQAQVLTSGRAQSVLNENHIKRTRYAHQVSLVSLHVLKQNAYKEYCENVLGPPKSFDMWNQHLQSAPQFKFWSTIIELELLMCRFVRSLREGDFKLYVQSCDELCGWFHVMDHTNYARWLPVHVRDMVTLAEKHPAVHAEFMKGNFVVQKSPRKFSLIAKDQAHEQSNKTLQAHGGAVGLYENPEALTLFMLAGPDCARIVKEFETINNPQSPSTSHHEEGHNLQVKFHRDVSSFVEAVEHLGNPFLATNQELVALDTQNVMEPSVSASLSQIREMGENLHASYVTKRLEETSLPVSNTIKRNNVLTFSNRPDPKAKGVKDIGVQRHNMSLVTQLFLSLQSRPDSNMMDFFQFENQREPPSLADRGLLRTGTKSDILQCLNAPNGRAAAAKEASVVVLDMAAVIHMVRPTTAKTFNEYVSLNIIPFLQAQMNDNTQRIDAVWDNYPEENNLKALTQKKRGNGPRTRVGQGNTQIPKSQWNSGFLKNEENKKELFSFISTKISRADMDGKLLITTKSDGVLSNRPCDLSNLQPCNHAEADTRIILHLVHAAQQGHKKAYVRTVDSDIIVLALRFFETLGLTELWVGFGTGKSYRDIPIHTMWFNLGKEKSLALPLFHSLTGCDTTSQFLGCGKKTAWSAWTSTPGLTETLITLIGDPELLTLDSVHMQRIERFVVLMYNKGCSAAGVNEARHRLFTSGSRSLENIPPTQAALFQHIKRALLQASYYWCKSTLAQQEIPDFSLWGWIKDGTSSWGPLWTTLNDASAACAILLHCSCLKSCTGRCKCSRAGVQCTTLCKCEGGCVNNKDDEQE